MSLIARLKAKALNWAKPLPFQCRYVNYSTISTLDDEPGHPSRRLLDLSLAAIMAARDLDLSHISSRMTTNPRYPDIWPGEHI